MKKIIFINKNLWSFCNFRYELAKHISTNNKVYCLYGGPNKHTKKKLKNVKYKNIGLSQIPISLIEDIKYLINLFLFIRKTKPDIVHCFNPKPVLFSFFTFIFFKKIKLYLTITGLGHSFLTRNSLVKFFFNIWYQLAFLRADKIFFQNKLDLKYFNNKGFIKKEKIFTSIGLGIDVNNKSKIYASKRILSFGFVGRLTKEKGIFEYLNAIKLIQKKNFKETDFYLVKNFDTNSPVGLSRNKLKQLITGLGLKIKFLKFNQKINKIFDKFDILVFPSYREGASKTLMEASAYGIVTLASDVPGCNNIIIHKKNGLLFKSQSSQSIYNSIQYILKNKSQLKKMSYFSKKFAKKNLDQKKIIKKLEKFYQ
tara:strand:+ start:905 stop:2008 length:1104 start_codon:yes stop_codon:yes gene_type:complete